MERVNVCAKEVSENTEYDVVIVGAGVSGIAATLASSRAGAKTLLIEKSGGLGGIDTNGLVASVTNYYFNAAGDQVIKGIAFELIDELVKMGKVPISWMTPTIPQIPHDADTFQAIVIRKLREAKVDILVLTMVTDVLKEENKITHVICNNKAGVKAFRAKAFVDASGDADLAYFANAPFEYESGCSASLMFEMGNVNLDLTFEYFQSHPRDFDETRDIATTFQDFQNNYLERGIFHTPHGGGADLTPLQRAIQEGRYAKEKGLARRLDALGLFAVRGSNKILVNSNFYYLDPMNDMFTFSRAHLEARERCLETAEILKEVLPGFENAYVTRIAPELGVRVTRTIKGKGEITIDDLETGTKFDDVIGVIPGWHHIPGDKGKKLATSTMDLPLSILLPQSISNLVIGSGRSVSGRKAVWSVLRGQVGCMVIGQAAGGAAALMKDDINAKIPIKKLQKLLLEQGVYLGGDARLTELGLRP